MVDPSDRRPVSVEEALALFDTAAERDDLRAEALIRGGVLLHKVGRHSEALTWLDRVPAHDDRALGYVHRLTYGRLLDGAGRSADAAAAYAAALEHESSSQPAAIGLAAALLRSGRAVEATEAATRARQIDNAESARFDLPYRRGDMRFVPGWLAEIRKARRVSQKAPAS
jgi:tetratricopeptide (TPR) repeat protein